jgi:predicted metal-dependent phosphoesterase TrpH
MKSLDHVLFHVHTKYSYDSFMEPEKIISVAKSHGYKGVAFTDHQNIKGGILAEKINKDPNFKVIIGGEYHTSLGDVIGLNLKKNITAFDPYQVINEIKKQGGIVIWAHPFRTFLIPRGRGKRRILPPVKFLRQLDYVETYNAHTKPNQNQQAKDLAIKYHLKEISGLDAHFYWELRKNKLSGFRFIAYLGTFFCKNFKRIVFSFYLF